jgi:hypothetical protein
MAPSENQLSRWFDTDLKSEFLKQARKLAKHPKVKEHGDKLPLAFEKLVLATMTHQFRPLSDEGKKLLEDVTG